MLLEGRKQPRAPKRFLMQISAVHDALSTDLDSVENLILRGVRVTSGRSWELGSHVDVKSRVVELTARARAVYCQPVDAKTFAVGLNFLMQTHCLNARSEPATSKPQSNKGKPSFFQIDPDSCTPSPFYPPFFLRATDGSHLSKFRYSPDRRCFKSLRIN